MTEVSPPALTCLESVNRVSKLPAVESSFYAAHNIYEKIKDYNSMTQWTCSTAENVINKAFEVGKPIAIPFVQTFETPIKKVDIVLCSGLDYVETKVPAVKLPPGEFVYQIYTSTKDYVNNNVTPSVGAAYAYVEPTIKSAYEKIEPSIEIAKTLVEPAVEKTLTIVDPLVQPVLEKVYELKEYGSQVVEEIIHNLHNHSEEAGECEACQKAIEANREEQQNN